MILSVSQLSFFSAEANPPRVGDLAGVLCGPGRAVGFGSGAAVRISLVARDSWRVCALRGECAKRQVNADELRSEEGLPVLRTAFQANLASLAVHWACDSAKTAPPEFVPDGAVLRMWALTSGEMTARGYEFELDQDAEHTHRPLWTAANRAGVGCKLASAPGRGAVLRVTGARRLRRLAELMGPAPDNARNAWPSVL